MNAIIFGANGQDGHYLSELCQSKGITPIGISRSGEFLAGDVADRNFVDRCIIEYKPHYIFHLAANSTTGHNALFENHHTISTGTLNILESVYVSKLPVRIFIAGSGVQFLNQGKPIDEDTPFEASSPYSIARIQSVYAARYYRTLGVKAYVGYLFHHESPLRKPNHMSQKIVRAIRNIQSGAEESLVIGDLSVQKEWTFAGDIAKAIFTLVEQDNVFEAVLGSGIPHSIQDWIELCFSKSGLDWRKYVREIPGFIPEYKILVSNPRRIRELGWKPLVDLSGLASLMLEQNLST